MKVGIIGGGVGGLAVAWNLSKKAKGAIQIHVFEAAPRFGGNVDTKYFDFGKGPGYQDKPLERWCDMGVNDFNIPAYQNIVEVMDEIGFVKHKDYRNLEDSTTYYTTKGHAITANSRPNGTPDPWWGTAMPEALRRSADSFMEIAGKDGEDHQYAHYTMEEYITAKSKQHGWVDELGPEVIYPRVNGMYFTSSVLGPRNMPFAAVMHYYKIQEGAGGEKADRNYFVGGSSNWIDRLIAYMKETMPEITFHTGFKASVATECASGKMTVRNMAKDAAEAVEVDRICLACPADEALRAMEGTSNPAEFGLPQEAAHIMSQITYESAVSVAHTDARLLPVNRNAWSTYNIVIHEPGSVALKPYVINYVANRHQNDAANPEFDGFGLPEFFLSVNPHIPVAEDKVLVDHRTGEKAMAYLKHFTFDFACIQAQADIIALQGKAGIYYASGWTRGSGLHTECWAQGEHVAQMITDDMGGKTFTAAPAPDHAEVVTARLAAAAKGVLAPH